MRHCPNCGHQVERIVPEGDNRLRDCCPQCGAIHYSNPNVVAGTLPLWEGRILMCRRAIEPRLGLWTLPAGFLENGESLEEAALRETREESCAEAEISQLYTLFSLPEINQVYMFFLAEMTAPDFANTPESSEVELVDEANIPWNELAFPVVRRTLELFIADRTAEQGYPIRHEVLLHRPPRSAGS